MLVTELLCLKRKQFFKSYSIEENISNAMEMEQLTGFTIESSDSYTSLNVKAIKWMIIIGIISTGTICSYLVIGTMSAEVYTYSTLNEKKRIGRLFILKMGNCFGTVINKRIMQKSETGKYELVFSKEFIEKNCSKIFLVKINGNIYRETIQARIIINEFIE